MKYNFDEVIDRRGTGAVRWDTVMDKYGEAELIPLTTADMDFRCAEPVCEAIRNAVDMGVFGYTKFTPSYYDALIKRFKEKWKWQIEKEWIMFSPGVVGAIAYCVQGLTQPGDGIVLPVPMYHPFAHLIKDNGREILRSPLKNEDNYFTLDYDGLEAQLSKSEAKVLIFCNPHNPIGRAWSYDELYRVCQLCLKHGVTLISDEIHCDFVFPGREFVSAAVPMSDLGGLDSLIVCSSASKSFNLAGLQTSDIIIPGEKARKAYKEILGRQHMMELNLFGPKACEAAYRFGGEWQEQVKQYLLENRDYIVSFLAENVPEIVPVIPEATYMMWLDCRALGMSDDELNELFVHRAKVGLNIGSSFGIEGTGYVRLNFATPRSVLRTALERIAEAVHGR